jgi:hypothetical protein
VALVTVSGFATLGRDFTSTLETGGPSSWLTPFGVISGDALADELLAMVAAGWRTLDRDWLADRLVRVVVARSGTTVDLRIECITRDASERRADVSAPATRTSTIPVPTRLR